jgi:Tfp pilus assembly protein PilO
MSEWLSRSQWQQRIGLPGIAAIGLLVFCAVMYFSASRPLDRELMRLGAEQAAQRAATARPVGGGPQQFAALLRQLPHEAELATHLAAIHQMARQQGIVLRRGSFELNVESHGRILRQQMTFQALAPYRAVRRFTREALAAMPALALEDVAMVRSQGEPNNIEASLQFSMLLARTREP